MPTDSLSEGLLMTQNVNRCTTLEKQTEQSRGQVKQIDILPDDVLLEIFGFYMNTNQTDSTKTETEVWRWLVQVCRRWRSLVFQSPRHLNLRLYCTHRTPVKGKLDVWPALPLVVTGSIELSSSTDLDNVIAALEQSNRICEVKFDFWSWHVMEKVLAAMQLPLPELTDLQLGSFLDSESLSAIPLPDSFLGRSAPSLRHFSLSRLTFPELPKLLLSATHLVSLKLSIPHSGYISPEAMVALISALSSLEELHLKFRSPQSRPDRQSRSLPPPKRSIVPVLNIFHFKGVTEYLEDLVTHIDTPQLNILDIKFFNQIGLDCHQLAQFINSTPTLRALDKARVQFDGTFDIVKLRCWTSQSGLDYLEIGVSSRELDLQLSSIEQVCNSFLYPLCTVEDLYIERPRYAVLFDNNPIENTLWLQLLLPFTAMKNLYLSKEFALGIAAALQDPVEGRLTEALPVLQNIFVEELEPSGHFQENVGEFIAARRLSDRPIVISKWDIVISDSESDTDSDMGSM